MSKIIIDIDPELKGKELYKFLRDNKKQLIAQKKMDIKKCDPVNYSPGYFSVEKDLSVKAISGEVIPPDADSFRVKVVANTSMWCDTAMDVLLRDSGKKSMKERKGLIPHIHDHEWMTDAEVGDVQSIYYEDVSLRELGVKQEGSAQALIFETDIIRSYNERIFDKYRNKKVKQHSIGLRYVNLLLALNEPDDEYYEDEYKVWKKYIDQIINKDYVESKGYFWAVPEYMLLENSCVLFGANQLTPTLSTGEKSITEDQPPVGTGNQPIIEEESVFNLDEAIKNTKFFN